MNTTTTTEKAQKTILVIEDERSLLDAIKTTIEKHALNVITARSVEQAFDTNIEKNTTGAVSMNAILDTIKYLEILKDVDAIWLDHNLIGDEDGLAFVKKFKANGGRLALVPIFVVSNTSNPETVKAYNELGIQKYYVKAEHKLESIISDIKSFLDTAST